MRSMVAADAAGTKAASANEMAAGRISRGEWKVVIRSASRGCNCESWLLGRFFASRPGLLLTCYVEPLEE